MRYLIFVFLLGGMLACTATKHPNSKAPGNHSTTTGKEYIKNQRDH